MKSIRKKELIGLDIEVVSSKNKANIGIKGKIIDETKETLVLREGKKIKRLLKKNIIFTTIIEDKKIMIDGKILSKRPEERIKSR